MTLISPRITSSFTAWLKSRWKYIVERNKIREVEGYIPELKAAYIIEGIWRNVDKGKLTLWISDEKYFSNIMKHLLSVAYRNGFKKLILYVDTAFYQRYIKKS